MFDPLIKHYQRLNNIKPSAEISSVFSGSNKRRKRQKSASGYPNQSAVGQRNASFGKPRRPHSSIVVYGGNNNSIADSNNNYYNGLQMRRNSSSNLNTTLGPSKYSKGGNGPNHDKRILNQNDSLQQHFSVQV